MSDRCGEVLRGVPIATVFLIFLNVSIHAFVFLFTIDVRDCTLHPRRVLYFYEYYRCISAALLHGGALHILMNMMTLFSLGSSMVSYRDLTQLTCYSYDFGYNITGA